MSLILGIVFIAAWIVPFTMIAKPDKKAFLRMVISFFASAVLGTLLCVLLRMILIFLLRIIVPSVSTALATPFVAGITEEPVKFLIAFFCIRKWKSPRTIDLLLVFGAAGAGFELTEMILNGMTDSDILLGIVRGVLAMHIVWLYLQGFGWIRHLQKKKLAIFGSLLICIATHILFDLGIVMIGTFESGTAAYHAAIFVEIAALILNIALIVIVLIKMIRQLKAVSGK